MKPDGTNVTRLADNIGGENVSDFAPSDFDPASSADGAKITFVRFDLSCGTDVYTIKAHGTN